MQKITLEILFQIIGIGSASGIISKDQTIYFISDSSTALYSYQVANKTLDKIPLFENAVMNNIPKSQKPDFEAIANYGDDYYIFGSGSTENRNKMMQYNATTQQIKTVDLTDLYALMQNFSDIKPEDFNIEGVVFTGETWYFFQRGNGKKTKNGVFTVQGKNLENDFSILFNDYKLPKIKGVRTSFTDAVLVDGLLYFLAAAEDSKSTYDDGEVLGSIIGTLNLGTMKIDSTHQISDTHKMEGITLYKKSEHQIEFLLCEDNDSEILESNIFKLTIAK